MTIYILFLNLTCKPLSIRSVWVHSQKYAAEGIMFYKTVIVFNEYVIGSSVIM